MPSPPPVLALAVACLFLVLPLSAGAKGPESGSLTGPGIDEPIELIDPSISNDHQRYGAFMRLVEMTGLWYGSNETRIDGPNGPLGAHYTLTWVNSGPPGKPIEERTIQQFIYLRAGAGPVVHTPEQPGLEGWGDSVIGWFAAPDELVDSFIELGVEVERAWSVRLLFELIIELVIRSLIV